MRANHLLSMQSFLEILMRSSCFWIWAVIRTYHTADGIREFLSSLMYKQALNTTAIGVL
jgi:hypothetical protein